MSPFVGIAYLISPHNSLLRQWDINCVRLTSRNSAPTRPEFSRQTNLLGFPYKLCESSITRTDFIESVRVLIVSTLCFHHRVDYIFFQAVMLCLIRTVTFFLSSPQRLLMLYCTVREVGLSWGRPLVRGIPFRRLMPASLSTSSGSSYLFVIVVFSTIRSRTT